MHKFIHSVTKKFKFDQGRLLDIFWCIQDKYRHVSEEALEILSSELKLSIPELRDCLTFYHFFHLEHAGKTTIYVDTSVVAENEGVEKIIETFEKETGTKIGGVSASKKFGLFKTSCIGMSDQLPAALINGLPVTKLSPNKVKKIMAELKKRKKFTPKVMNKLQLKGPLLSDNAPIGSSIKKLASLKPSELIHMIKESGLRGRGGAGFPTGTKWEYCANQEEKVRYLICNADEGEPGTFKDRYLLTKHPNWLIEGMVTAAYAIGAQEGFIYLRGEYLYLKDHLQKSIDLFKKKKYLGKNIAGIKGFNFNIRIQLGAGAYVVGEETALIESLEGKRGEPRVRPPFPASHGYLGKPTVVNNVETLIAAGKICFKGPGFWNHLGTKNSKGTKLLSISGDCEKPGIYEIEWGTTIAEILKLAKAKKHKAMQVGGPSGVMINTTDKKTLARAIAFEDLPTGGSMMIFDQSRDILDIVRNFTQFFVNESCGCCLPCRAGNILFKEQIQAIKDHDASIKNLNFLKEWAKIVEATSRCGLGQTCANPIISSMNEFPDYYKQKVQKKEILFHPFDEEKKTKEYLETVVFHEEN